MYPSLLSNQIQQNMRLFLQQMFPVATPYFRDMVKRLTEREDGVFQGPWYELRLPFQKATEDVSAYFNLLNFPYSPHKHQAEAFARLCGENPRSTLVATGTGSGKTECFLYPILEHCAQAYRRQKPGIKAVILYPMNALATDQARRFAATVHSCEALKGVRVGMYVGGATVGSKNMTEDGVITDRHAMQSNPPDILLTNYKMLDYLLVRREDSTLWKDNSPNTLRYLAVDELHTFDGAQATDLACLIRRLKERLECPPGYLCCIGTSATLGGDSDITPLLEYAETIFGESFDKNSLIRESGMTPEQFRGDAHIDYFNVPGKEHIPVLNWDGKQELNDWLKAQYCLWFDEEAPDLSTPQGRFTLGDKLLRHRFLAELLKVCQKRKQWIMEERELMEAIVSMERSLEEREVFRAALSSFLSLCAQARRFNPENKRNHGQEPFIKLHTHLWMRELSAMMSPIAPGEDGKPELCFSADLPAEQKQNALSLVYCLDCGRMSWGCVTAPMKPDKLIPSRDAFNRSFFGDGTDALLLTPITAEEHLLTEDLYKEQLLCPRCMQLHTRPAGAESGTPCHVCGEATVRVLKEVFTFKTPQGYTRKECPCCKSRDGLMVVGSRSASMNSTAIGTMFASPCNDDKKLLTFSDNVQDASHRAGFFTGRTYQNTLRIAFCQAIRGMAESGKLSLLDACEGIGKWWRHRMDEKEFIGTFMPPDKEWLDDYDEFTKEGKLPEGSDLPELIEARLNWAFFTEMSWRNRRGRTLERSGCYILQPDGDKMATAVHKIASLAVEQLGSAYKLPKEALQQWMTGLLHWLRDNGAIMIPMLESYATTASDFAFNKKYKKSLKGLSHKSRPQMLTDNAKNKNFLPAYTQSVAKVWTEDWTLKLPWPVAMDNKLKTHDFILLALTVLKEVELLLCKQADTTTCNMGINPTMLKVTGKVCAVRCSECGHVTPIPADMADVYRDMPCMRKGCKGHLTPEEIGDNASRRMYESGKPVRLRSAEHTGLLERETREKIEKAFIHQTPITAPNLLSCTPTLEMGIDIGDLSSVLLCSVPPSVASFRQRVGRAGRRDGNAFTLTTAANQTNDLYFFHAPENMIRGQVEMPGIFLKAPAILERQLFAFCLGKWIKENQGEFIPKKLSKVLGSLDNEQKFPQNLFRYMAYREDEILSKFFHMLGDELDEAIKEELELKLKGDEHKEGSLAYRISMCLHRTRKERDDYSKKSNAYKKKKDKLNRTRGERGLSPAEEEELKDLEQARSGMNSLIREIDKKETLGFLTDEGLLPNYAFPEEGVTLHSVILKHTKKDGKDAYKSISTDYVRSGSSAITEFAPGNAFYVEGHKVVIDQINLRTSEEEEWVFCPECTHMERVGENGACCPRCHADWSDGSHRRTMLRLNQVTATSSDRESRSLDDKDDRDPSFYSRHMAVSIPEGKEGESWALDNDGLTFAFQYIHQAIFREINMGNLFHEGSSLLINGIELQSPGFEICDKCGKLMKNLRKNNEKLRHDLDCPYRNKPANEQKKKTLLVYRELKYYAGRILLSKYDVITNTVKEAFMSALILGLKKYFRGNIGHLKICEDSIKLGEPPNEQQHPCLVIYDAVPGGTGYLKELCQNPMTLLTVFELALRKMEECECAQAPDKDGCHLCILSARRGKDSAPSRRVAMKLLHEVLAAKEHLRKLTHIDEVNINSLLGSELEARFLNILKNNYLLKSHLVEGSPGYLLKVGDLTWEVRLQKEIAGQIPQETTIPDFLITPLRQRDSKPIAVYLDGKAWHASEGVNRMSGDVRKREALRRNHKYLVWTLTWDDLVTNDMPLPTLPLNTETRNRMLDYAGDDRTGVQRWLQPSTSMRLLEYLLMHGSERLMRVWQKAAGMIALSFNSLGGIHSAPLYQLRAFIEQGCDDVADLHRKEGELMVASVREDELWRMVTMVTQDKMNELRFDQVIARISFNNDKADDSAAYTQEWRAFWYLYNILQALPDFHATTPELGRDGYLYESMNDADDDATDILCPEDLEDLDADWIDLLCSLKLLDKPEAFYEGVNEAGEIIGLAEVAWEEKKIAIFRQDDTESAEAFTKLGWTTFLWGKPDELAAELKAQLTTAQ